MVAYTVLADTLACLFIGATCVVSLVAFVMTFKTLWSKK